MTAPAFTKLLKTTVANQYRLERLLGAGGMGAVFAAHDLNLKRDVAVKIVQPHLTANRQACARFLREARITAALRHPNIVQVHTAGENDDGNLYLVQELLDGPSLGRELQLWPGSPDLALTRFTAVLQALARAHRQGVIHRDVKPNNVVLAREELDERVVLLDFGLAKELEPDPGRSALTGSVMPIGTAEYMSPEQAEGAKDIDARTDVWSAGVLLYELLTRETPWEATTLPAILVAITRDPVPDVRERCRWPVPAGLAAVLGRAIARDRARRYADAGEFLRALEGVDLAAFRRLRAWDRRPANERERERSKQAFEARGRRPPEMDAPWELSVERWLWCADRHRVPARRVAAVRRCVEAGLAWEVEEFERHLHVVVGSPPVEFQGYLRTVGFEPHASGWWVWFGETGRSPG